MASNVLWTKELVASLPATLTKALPPSSMSSRHSYGMQEQPHAVGDYVTSPDGYRNFTLTTEYWLLT